MQDLVKNGFISKYFFFVFHKYLTNIVIKKDIIYINIVNHRMLINLLNLMKNNYYLSLNLLSDFSAFDLLSESSFWRFELFYNLVSLFYSIRCIVKVKIFLTDFLISLSDLFPSSRWLEREVWDMFGIFFFNHHDLRRLLTDYGFLGHPLRKDFPVIGFVEVLYDESLKVIVVNPVELMQEMRMFDIIEKSW